MTEALTEARQQAARYAEGATLQSTSNLKRVALVYKGIKIAAVEVF